MAHPSAPRRAVRRQRGCRCDRGRPWGGTLFECKAMAPEEVFGSYKLLRALKISRNSLAEADCGPVDFKRGSATTDGNALPKRDPPDVTRFRSATAKRVQAHRARARMGLRVPDGSGQRPHSAPPDQHRSPLPGEQRVGVVRYVRS
jgi:hypothetical protein